MENNDFSHCGDCKKNPSPNEKFYKQPGYTHYFICDECKSKKILCWHCERYVKHEEFADREGWCGDCSDWYWS